VISLKNRLFRYLIYSLVLPLVSIISPTISQVHAVTDVSKTITVKNSNGTAYSGALVQVRYYVNGAEMETAKPVQTTNSSGQVTISYPADSSYAQLMISPPSSDLTNSVMAIDLLVTPSSQLSDIRLKTASVVVKTVRPDGTESGLGTCINYPKVNYSRWITAQYRTVRTGAFGIYLPSDLYSSRDYFVEVSPCSESDFHLASRKYGLRRASNGTFSLYSDGSFATAISKVDNAYVLQLGTEPLTGQIKNSDGSSFNPDINSNIYIYAEPLNRDGTRDIYRGSYWSNQVSSDGNFSIGGSKSMEKGRYRLKIGTAGTGTIPLFTGPTFWVDADHYFSTTETGTYSSSLNLTMSIPNSGLINFKVNFADGSAAGSGNRITIFDKDSMNLKYSSSGNTPTNSQSKASLKLNPGNYTMYVNPKSGYGLTSEYSLSVTETQTLLTDSLGAPVAQVGDYFPVSLKAANLKLEVVLPTDNSRPSYAEAIIYSGKDGSDGPLGWLYMDSATTSMIKLVDGVYQIRVNEERTIPGFARKIYDVVVSSGNPVVKLNGETVSPVSGVYKLSPGAGVIAGTVLAPTGSEAIKFARVELYKGNLPYPEYSQYTDVSGKFYFDLGYPPANGQYRLIAYPVTGVNALQGVSDSVTVTVANGSGPTNVEIRLRAANISGVVTGPNGLVSPENWLAFSESKTTYSKPLNIEGPLTDKDGAYSLYLGTGKYEIAPSPDYQNAKGVPGKPTVCTVGGNPATAVTCDVKLETPTVTGKVSIGGAKPFEFIVGLGASFLVDTNTATVKDNGTYWSDWTNEETYGMTVPAGTYRTWLSYKQYSGLQITVPGPLCTVPTTGNVVCDISLPATNLKLEIQDIDSSVIKDYATVSISRRENSQYFWTCCTELNQNSNYLLDGTINNGRADFSLIDGSYMLTISPSENSKGISKSYFFDVVSGTTTNMRTTYETTTYISASGSIYRLAIEKALVTGHIYDVDGQTPARDACYLVSNSSGEEMYSDCIYNSSGTFLIPSKFPAGTYSVYAYVQSTLTRSNSSNITFTIDANKTPITVNLRLNKPNLIGTVTGPSGVAINTVTYAEKLTSGATYSRVNVNGFTDTSGKFGFYLDPGTYRITNVGDFANSGGVRGSSSNCVVTSDSTTAVTCNVSLPAPNISGTVSVSGRDVIVGSVTLLPYYTETGTAGTSSYYYINVTKNRFGLIANPGTYRMYVAYYNKQNGQGKDRVPAQLCIVPATGSVTCDISIPQDNFSFDIQTFDNKAPSSSVGVGLQIRNGFNDKFWDSFEDSSIEGSARFSYPLVDGVYKLYINPYKGTDGGRLVINVTVTNGAIVSVVSEDGLTSYTPTNGVYTFTTKRPNLVGTAIGPRGVIANTYIEVQQVFDGGLKWMGKGFNTDELGKYALSLDPGTYQLKIFADFATTGASQTTIKCVIQDTTTVVTCDANLGAPNLTGTVKVNGSLVVDGSIIFEPNWSSDSGSKNSYGWLNFSDSGQYGTNAAAGSYVASLIYYPAGKWSIQPLGPCLVPETGTVNCNFTLPASNFKLQIKSRTNAILTDAYAHITRKYGEGYQGPCCTSPRYSNSNQMEFSLLDGDYQVRIWANNSNDGAQQIFTFTVESATVINMKLLGSSTVISPNSGIYQLQLSPPAFSGQVLMPNGTTPAPNTMVRVIGSTVNTWVNAGTDGKFSVDLGQMAPDGIYTFQAFANRFTYNTTIAFDSSVANSLIVEESRTAGSGNQNIQLILKSPNVKGRVAGTKGALKNRDIQIQQKDGLDNWNWTDIQLYTDTDGNYGVFLKPGTYRIFSNGDMRNSGGGDTYSPSFTIDSATSSVQTINITLTPPNASGTIKSNGINIASGWINFYRDYSVDNNNASWYSSDIYNGGWGISAIPGSYVIFARDYSTNNGPSYAGRCVVPVSGSVTCDYNLPAPNLVFKVKDINGAFISDNVYALTEVVESTTAGYRYVQGTCCTSTDQVAQDGKIKLSLGTAIYRIRVNPSNPSIAGTSQSYIVKVESFTVKSVVREIDSVNIDSQTDTSYILQLQSPAISGTVYRPDNTTVASNMRVCISNESGSRFWWRSCTYSNSAGKFTFENSQVSNGTWKVQAFPQYNDASPDLTIGASALDSLTVTNNVGSKTLRLVLRTPNVTGSVTGPLGVSAGNWVNVRRYFDDGSFDYLDNVNMRTDSLGRYAFALDPGKYRFQAQDDMAKAGGTSALSADCIVAAGSNATCNVVLIAPNVSGLVRVSGVATPASVEFIRQGASTFEYLGYYSGSNKSGQYWINLPAGTYRPRLYLYNQGQYVIGAPCVVPAAGNTTCNLDIPSSNFKFKVTTSSGAVTTKFYGTVALRYGITELWAGNLSAKSSSETITSTSFVDGTYRISIEPYWEDRALGSAQLYTLDVSAGVITSLKRDGSTTSISPVDGVYTLQMGVPSIAGSVVAPDSVTAVPYAQVNAFLNPYNAWGTEADKSGAFSFNKLPDGTYSVIAFPSWGDATKAQSAPSIVTVSGGVGATDLSLKLRAPNVSGVISGPKGVSKFNWITPEIKDPAGYWRVPDYTRGIASTAEGNFSFYLEPGTYRFRTAADLKNAGGSATISNVCTVPSTGSVTCNISMTTPNVKFRIVEPGQTSISQGSYPWVYLYTAPDWSAIKNYNPPIEYDDAGNLQGFLEDGTWTVVANPSSSSTYAQAQYRVTVSGGVVTRVENESQETLTANAGIYYLPLKSSNISGTITANGSAFIGGVSVTAQRLDGKYYYQIANKWIDQGTFAFNLPAGTYRFEARPYWSKDGLDVTVTRSQTCEVPVTGSATCNFSLKAPNLLGLVVDDSSTAFRYVDAAILTMNTDSTETWDQWLDNRDGYFKTYLPDGKYRIQINPYWNYRALYTERSYVITVLNESLTSIVDLTTNDTITAVDGIYRLRMGTPSVKGRVLIPGSETVGATNVDVRVAPSNQPTMWRYGANADSAGNFSLLLPNGTYVIQAFPYGAGFLYGKSETQTITISNGSLVGGAVTLRLRSPNTYGRVVTPQGSPLANANVQLWIDGEAFYGWTSEDGRFSAYVDKESPNCPANCYVSLNYWASADYTAKSYPVNGKGNLADVAIGGISTLLTVLAPVDGGKTSPSAYGFVSVIRIDGSNRYWVSGSYTNQDGKVGLSLTQGLKYEITASPGKEFIGKFAPKKLVIESFDTNTMATLSMTFPSPNLKVVVLGSDSSKNSQGWFTISTWDSATSTRNEISGNYLNDDGKAALTLDDGTYKIRFWPGRSKGVQKEITVSVLAGVVTVSDGLSGSDTYSSSTASLRLPSGNITGTVKDGNGTSIGKAVVAAYRSDDPTKLVTTVADENGYYEINLDLTYTWDVKALNPANSALGQRQITSWTPSNAVLVSQDITVVAAG